MKFHDGTPFTADDVVFSFDRAKYTTASFKLYALESGAADLALGFVPWLESGFYQQTLFPQDWVCLVSSKHPRIRDTLTLRAYNEEGHVAITGGTGAQLLEDTMRRQSVRRRVVCELPGFLGLSGVVSATDLIATSPRQIGETLAAMGGLNVMECPLTLPPVKAA